MFHTYDFLSPPTSLPRGNITGSVTDMLRQAIVEFKMKPGDPIDKKAICNRLGVSLFPVSEALTRLGTEGLVDILPRRGSSVSLIRMSEIAEFMLIRMALECEVVQRLAQFVTAKTLAALEASIAEQEIAAEIGNWSRFAAADIRFHEQLFAGLNVTRVKSIVEISRANTDRASNLAATRHRLAATIEEHRHILAALIDKNAEAATRAMRAHTRAVMVELAEVARQNPAYFAPESHKVIYDAY